MKQLLLEYKQLQADLFGECKFSVVDDSDKQQQRYSQLFQYFHPQFRTKSWVNPLNS